MRSSALEEVLHLACGVMGIACSSLVTYLYYYSLTTLFKCCILMSWFVLAVWDVNFFTVSTIMKVEGGISLEH